jgi:5-methylthioribose kinase
VTATTPDQTARLRETTVLGYLVRRGVVTEEAAGSETSRVQVLGGGVSADVFAVWTPDGAWVVKQALSQLRVRQRWLATPQRAVTEGRALALAARILPGRVPPLVLVDADAYVVVEGMAPTGLVDWKAVLLAGGGGHDVATARGLGDGLAVLHRSTWDDPSLEADFGDTATFVELRIVPFHRASSAARPELAARLSELAADLFDRPRCLVHGDFSPKNILADGGRLWVLDWEVAHLGNPVFDLAFLVAHLVCKAVHAPGHRPLYQACAETFLDAYRAGMPAELVPKAESLAAHVAAIVVARTDGMSPADYLDDPQRDRARDLARRVLDTPSTTIADLWRQLP